LTPQSAFDISWAYEFPDEEKLARAMLSPGLIVELMEVVGEETVRTAIVGAWHRIAFQRGATGSRMSGTP
jgi:hypothetical protein